MNRRVTQDGPLFPRPKVTHAEATIVPSSDSEERDFRAVAHAPDGVGVDAVVGSGLRDQQDVVIRSGGKGSILRGRALPRRHDP
jgi:hypothetical protein